MRIQHNIIAMNAYRNYTGNTSAMQKNLERLSSGYKINRAGDDAAGLAISEKMRAQITGLEVASKNAKDGISLVQTAEGALTEVHDMLNRMVELATMSANGTYAGDTDRLQLQKEVDQLRDEINRIADSANFNGIQLLDGSMDGDAVTTSIAGTGGAVNGVVGGTLPAVANNPYDDLGVNTVLHQDVKSSDGGSTFGINFHDFKFTNQPEDSLTIQIGEGDNAVTIELTVDKDAVRSSPADGTDVLQGQEIVDAIVGGTSASNGFTVTINGEEYANGDIFEINGQEFVIDEENSGNGVLAFKQLKAPTEESEVVDASMKVTISGVQAPVRAEYTVYLTDNGREEGTDGGGTAIDWAEGDKLTIAGVTLTADASGKLKLADGTELEDGGDAITIGGYDVTLEDGVLSIKAKEGGVDDKPKVSYEKAAVPVDAGTKENGADDGQEAQWKIGSGISGTAGTAIEIYIGDTKVTLDNENLKLADSGTTSTTFKLSNAADAPTYTVTYDGDAGSLTIDSSAKAQDNTLFSYSIDGGETKTTVAAQLNGNTGTTNGQDNKAASNTFDIGEFIEKGGTLTIGKDDDEKQTFTSWEQLDGAEVSINGHKYIASVDKTQTGEELKLTAVVKGATENTAIGTDIDDGTYVQFTAKGGTIRVNTDVKGTNEKAIGEGGAFVGEYQPKTVHPNTVRVDDNARLASTRFELTMAMIQEGAKIRLGDVTYVFTKDKENAAELKKGEVYMEYKEGDSLETIAEKFATAAKDSDIYSVGVEDGTVITLVEKESYATVEEDGEKKCTYGTDAAPKYDLRKVEDIERSIGFSYADYSSTEDAPGSTLTLQIGDTADEYNQLRVSIKDCHTTAMGIADISIADQESAAEAVDKVKDAINYVSDVRGTLGATQNRLDHTINNLSVMTENIQDAESTIRDTDVAEEMMAYTKNNILIQAAQAMLAQANQVPQGVLQLLQ